MLARPLAGGPHSLASFGGRVVVKPRGPSCLNRDANLEKPGMLFRASFP